MDREETGSSITEPSPYSLEAAVAKLVEEPEAQPEVDQAPEPEATVELEEAEEVESEEEPEEVPEESEDVPEDVEEEEAEEEEEESSEETAEAPEYYSVKVDGEELEVTFDELLSGYQRQSDYTRKTQTLAEERKAAEAKQSQFESMYAKMEEDATVLNEMLNRDLKQFEGVDWNALRAENPLEYVQKRIDAEEVVKQQQSIREQLNQYRQVQAEQMQQEALKQAEAEKAEMLKRFPEWKDETKRYAHQEKIVKFSKELGYTDEALMNLTARDLEVLEKARLYDELQTTKAGITKKKTAPAVRKPAKPKGKPATSTKRRKQSAEAKGRLRKSGSLHDAAAVLMDQMQNSKSIKK